MASTTTATMNNVEHHKDTRNNNFNNNTDWQEILAVILKQQRNLVNFKDYTVTEEHQNRMKELANTFPEVFDNPSSTDRSKWFNHPKYAMNIQMPQFHVHFRQEMQNVLGYLAKAHQVISSKNGKEDPQDYVRLAYRMFRGSMQGLHGHVHIEERAYIPIFQNLYHHIDFQFLYDDHEDLHETESKLLSALNHLATSTGPSHNDNNGTRFEEELVGAIQLAMKFDQELMTHLGEEEEIIVPLSLALKGRLPM